MAHNRMKQQVEQSRSERKFVEGDQVFLLLQPYKQTSLKAEHCQKQAPKFYGPYTVLKRVGKVAYQLALPNHSKLHHFFHVSFLKTVIGTKCQTQTNLPELDEEGSIWLQPQAILDQQECRLRQRTIKEVLVQWKYTTPADATWDPANIL
jgi:MarR-like DNA-binding transcriptional regulator SgrR of sgrS sRNA